MITFGAGVLIGMQRTNAAGAAVTNATPVQFGVLQDVSIDISFEEKLLYGASQFPVAFGRGKAKVAGKASLADFNGRIYGDLFLGTGTSASIRAAVIDSSNTIPTTPFQVTVVPPSSGTFLSDQGVRNATTGIPLTKVASAPAAGQYSQAGAIYTFASADTGNVVLISYEYSATSTTARVATISNQLMGLAPQFEVLLTQPFNGKVQQIKLPNCFASKLSLPLKNDDFTMADFEFSAIADAAGNVGYIATSE